MNSFNVSQVSTIVNAIASQMTGQTSQAVINNAADFAAVAQTLLQTGRDPVINAISQVFSRPVFAYRDYNAPLNDLYMDAPRWGNAVRKLSPVAMSAVDNQEFKWPVAYDATQNPPMGNGQSVDHYKISKQDVLQTNFYGSATYAQRYTIFKDQFDVAFNSPEEFGRFTAMLAAERKNDRETYKESLARGLQAVYIGALIDEGNTDRVVHLLTEYNQATGLATPLTSQTVYQPQNFAPFMRWAYARIKVLARMMGQRSQKYQTVITGKTILRHTPAENLRIAIYAPVLEQMDAMVLSTTFNDGYFEKAKVEGVNFWQSIDSPDSINVVPVYTDSTGALKTASAAVTQGDIFGVIHDRDALGYSDVDNWAAVTPLNIDGGYWNEAHHTRFKSMLDTTEKGVVLLLD